MAPAPFQMVSELVTPAYIYICLKQSLTCVSGDLITGEQLRHISVHICICYASPADHLCPDFIADYITSTAGTLQPEQPPRPVLITYFLVTTWSRTHQDHYWLHYKRYVVPPTPPQQVVRVIGSQCVSVILYTYICCCPLVTHVNTKLFFYLSLFVIIRYKTDVLETEQLHPLLQSSLPTELQHCHIHTARTQLAQSHPPHGPPSVLDSGSTAPPHRALPGHSPSSCCLPIKSFLNTWVLCCAVVNMTLDTAEGPTVLMQPNPVDFRANAYSLSSGCLDSRLIKHG